eukprot:scaffold108831_cov35-Tisochrysis_lutea.AAC.2
MWKCGHQVPVLELGQCGVCREEEEVTMAWWCFEESCYITGLGSAGMTSDGARESTRGTDTRGCSRARARRNKRHRNGENDGRGWAREL